jgi:hypothetical protein
MKLIIRDVPEEHWGRAINCAKQYMRDYPDRMGFHQFALYGLRENDPMLFVYRTKTSIIVRGS